jgi:dTDP-4-dehydrorhamnose reductase
MELWGGPECTVNRVGDSYFDQLQRTGHEQRASDLELFADIGLKTLRYPILWEKTEKNGAFDWTWADERLQLLQQLGIRPIVGLVHHGSGPAHTSLVSPCFPEKFTAYAAAFAQRYPWVDAYIPINEPLTTARFSGLYGHWYPHRRNNLDFARALLNEIRATVLALREIRKVNPSAQLVQSEDLGKVFSCGCLEYQSDFENERRWLTWDLLCGQVGRHHPMFKWFMRAGINEREILWFRDNPSPPDLLGINHYLTSDRYLNHKLKHFPAATHGGNGHDRYADVEAIRVSLGACDLGLGARISEAWERYRIPLAVTEVHLKGTIDERLNWTNDSWHAASLQKRRGADVRAITAWALLGSFDWDSLVTVQRGSYEPGVFDISSGKPEPTDVAGALRELIQRGEVSSPLQDAAWWRSEERLHYRPVENCRPKQPQTGQQPSNVFGALDPRVLIERESLV